MDRLSSGILVANCRGQMVSFERSLHQLPTETRLWLSPARLCVLKDFDQSFGHFVRAGPRLVRDCDGGSSYPRAPLRRALGIFSIETTLYRGTIYVNLKLTCARNRRRLSSLDDDKAAFEVPV
jgi:hypothetical protein